MNASITQDSSYYAATAAGDHPRPRLQGERTVDVCVIGAGYTGLSAALHLARNGRSVAVVEAR
ncbi:MAG: FAD-dependent oxidoreductase, partial [Ancalomicrobiaceae bacterium]|nr:FAD-dependent oxidoreductase [Ancalomicrobiaceae bacterium]